MIDKQSGNKGTKQMVRMTSAKQILEIKCGYYTNIRY